VQLPLLLAQWRSKALSSSNGRYLSSIPSSATATNPQGKMLDPEFMPWLRFTQMTDDALQAIWLYLQSLPAREFEK
jgi:hypothetical protein